MDSILTLLDVLMAEHETMKEAQEWIATNDAKASEDLSYLMGVYDSYNKLIEKLGVTIGG